MIHRHSWLKVGLHKPETVRLNLFRILKNIVAFAVSIFVHVVVLLLCRGDNPAHLSIYFISGPDLLNISV